MSVDQRILAMMNFQFLLEVQGGNNFAFQELTPPEIELPEIMQGAPYGESDIKLPGKPKFSTMTLMKIKPFDVPDNWILDWMAQAVINPIASRRTAFIRELAPGGLDVVQTWYIGEMWPQKRAGINYISTGDGEKLMEEVTFSVRSYYPQNSPGWNLIFGL